MADTADFETLRIGILRLITPEVPPQVTRFQAREALRQTPSATAGVSLFDKVDAYMQAQGGDALRAWEEVSVFVRTSPMVAEIGEQLGMSSSDVDHLFQLANSVQR